MNEKEKSIIWPIFLIFVGIFLLLNTTNILPWSVWLYLISFWPIFLVLGGLKLILGNSTISNILIATITVLSFLCILGIAFVNYEASSTYIKIPNHVRNFVKDNYSTNLEPKESTLKILSEEYTDVKKLNLSLNTGVSQYTLTDSEGELFTVNSTYFENYGTPSLEKELQGDSLNAVFSMDSVTNFRNFNRLNEIKYDFILGNKDVLTDISIDNGTGQGTVILEDSNIGEMDIRVGVGELSVTLGENAIPSEKLTLDIGTGELSLYIPANVGYTVEYDLGLGDIKINSEDINNEGNMYQSDNYDSATSKLLIDANIGVGSFNIVTK